MHKYSVSYTELKTVDIWASSPTAADALAQTFPGYYNTLQINDLGSFDFSVGQTVYYFDTEHDTILYGVVTDLNFQSADSVRVFVRFGNNITPKMFTWPEETQSLYAVLDDLLAYLGRELPSGTPQITLPTPSGLNATSITTTTFVLNWLAVSGAIGYNVYKDGALLYNKAPTSGVLVSGLLPSMTVSMRVAAVGTSGETEKSAPLEVTTLATLPSTPNGIAADNISDTSLAISWNPSLNAQTYRVYVNGSLAAHSITSTEYIVEDLIANTNYIIQVSAVNTGGESPLSTPVTFTTAPPIPQTPSGLGVSSITNNSAHLTWNFVPGATLYRVYLNDSLVVETGDLFYTLTGLSSSTAYSARVSAFNGTGESALSAAVNFTSLV